MRFVTPASTYDALVVVLYGVADGVQPVPEQRRIWYSLALLTADHERFIFGTPGPTGQVDVGVLRVGVVRPAVSVTLVVTGALTESRTVSCRV